MDATCAHCGLPAGRRGVVASVDGRREPYCCYGCVLASQVTRTRGEHGAAASILVRLGLAVFFAMNVMMLSLPTYAPVVYGSAADGPLFVVLRVLALAMTAPVLALLGWPILRTAWAGLRTGALNADGLIALGTFAAFALSVANTVRGRGAVYFDTAAMLLVLVTLGRWLEARARADAVAAVRATLAPVPPSAVRIVDGRREDAPPATLVPGDVVEVAPGAAFPTDGVVLTGAGDVDEAVLTGESRGLAKEPGAEVAGGSCSIDGLFQVRVTRPLAASTAARIAALLDDARRTRTAAERTADAVTRRLVPAVMLLAAGGGLWWTWQAGAGRGLLVALAVLVVACPCALGIATPVAVWMGLAAAARRGVIVRSGAALERVAALRTALFDKTGTVTTRLPRLIAIDAAPGVAAEDVLARAAALEAGLTHPVALAVAAAAAARGMTAPAAHAIRVVPGRGVRGEVGGERLGAGSVRFASEELGCSPATLAPADDDRVLVFGAGRLLGALRFAETPRAGAAEAIAELRALDVRPGLVTGDARAAAVVPALIPAADAATGLLPEEKLAYVRARRADGPTAMIGDGINDAPALAAADVGIAVGQATDLARLTADVALLGGDLRQVPWLIAHARRVRRVVRQNLAWSFGYNGLAVACALTGRLDPLVAALAMLGSSLGVVANARRLARG